MKRCEDGTIRNFDDLNLAWKQYLEGKTFDLLESKYIGIKPNIKIIEELMEYPNDFEMKIWERYIYDTGFDFDYYKRFLNDFLENEGMKYSEFEDMCFDDVELKEMLDDRTYIDFNKLLDFNVLLKVWVEDKDDIGRYRRYISADDAKYIRGLVGSCIDGIPFIGFLVKANQIYKSSNKDKLVLDDYEIVLGYHNSSMGGGNYEDGNGSGRKAFLDWNDVHLDSGNYSVGDIFKTNLWVY